MKTWFFVCDVQAEFSGHTAGISSVMFSPDGKLVVSGSEDESIKVWDAGFIPGGLLPDTVDQDGLWAIVEVYGYNVHAIVHNQIRLHMAVVAGDEVCNQYDDAVMLNGTQLLLEINASAPGLYSVSVVDEVHSAKTAWKRLAGSFAVDCSPGEQAIDEYFITSRCEPCGVGKFEVGGTCEDCEVGKYQNQTGTSECTVCPAGTSQTVAAKPYCNSCAAGKYTNNDTNKVVCIDCDVGTYQDGEASTGCQDCQPGTYTDESGHAVCKNCDPGTYSDENTDKVQCAPCEPGTFEDAPESTGCESCPSGRYADQSGQAECKDCDPGTYSDDVTSKVLCVSCSVGTYENDNGSTACDDCAPGRYQNGVGQVKCITCEPGRYTDVNTVKDNCALCDVGKYASNNETTSCDLCNPGKFQVGEGSQACIQCSNGTYMSTAGATECLACDGQVVGNYTTCTPCPDNAESQWGQCMCQAGFFST